MKIQNRKAQVASGLTWFAAFIIIFFIIILFTSASLIIAGGRKVTSGFPEIQIQGETVGSLRANLVLINLLNMPVEDEKMTVKDLVILSVDSYLKEEIIAKLKDKDINNLYLIRYFSAETFGKPPEILVKYGLSEEKNGVWEYVDQEKIGKIREVLASISECREYVLKIPQGYIYKVNGKEGFISDITFAPFKGEYGAFLSAPVILILEYKGNEIKVEYRERKIC